ncbi:RNA polymerase sigma factor [Salmonirosea aquatica]|uniref:Sigma-70 family RNA polymerase sigma factor n=1 Tax=Salmonirosea aquatica TaxID=2654236 RepID=A0A7C9BFV7_9BACT|nr:sigma-70 family RNA polymerase sigma factor [Cytophagaceae bacterium SJW1-29]
MRKNYIRPDENERFVILWQRSVAGDKEAFCQLVEAHYKVLFNYGATFTSDRELIKDTLQDLFIHLWEKRETLRIQYLTVYLLRSIRNNLFQSFRGNPFGPVAIDQEIHDRADEFTIENALIFQEAVSEKNQKISKAIATLPRRQKEVIFLKFYQGLDNEQIADLMQVNRQSVANLLHKAILHLRVTFDQVFLLLTAMFCDLV